MSLPEIFTGMQGRCADTSGAGWLSDDTHVGATRDLRADMAGREGFAGGCIPAERRSGRW